MKLVEPFERAPADPSSRKTRMEGLLSAWRRQPMWLPADGPTYGPVPPLNTALTVDASHLGNLNPALLPQFGALRDSVRYDFAVEHFHDSPFDPWSVATKMLRSR